MNEKRAREILARLFVPRAGGLEGEVFRSEYMKEDAPEYAVYEAVSNAQRDSGLTFDFSYEIGSRAANILAEAEDWTDDDDIRERIDSSVPIYTHELMQIYASDWGAVDEAREELGPGENSEREAAMAWYMLIERMVYAIRGNLAEVCEADDKPGTDAASV
jgi:hypothetical protein